MVELRRRALVLFTHLGDGRLLQKMLPENLDFLFGAELSALVRFVWFAVVAHGLFLVRKSILTQTPEKDISDEAEQSLSQVAKR
ncbi:MAG TPA: hypothetical protein VMV89_06270, partial [Candidatus Paceibacterota bacterium]|nr:hypothetical protein [Candidatus Paceibacterota bacterium]